LLSLNEFTDHVLTVVPWLFGLWLLAFIDRSNIGNAKIDGLVTDLKLNGNTFNIALAVFYVPYILVDVPSNWVLCRLKAGYYLPALIIGWGLVGMCMGFVKSFSGLIITRFFLGLLEGGLLVRLALKLTSSVTTDCNTIGRYDHLSRDILQASSVDVQDRSLLLCGSIVSTEDRWSM
jgi:hypothetical protein